MKMKIAMVLAVAALGWSGTAGAQSLPDALRPIGNLPMPLSLIIPHYSELAAPYDWSGFWAKPILTYQTMSFSGRGSHYLKDDDGVTLGAEAGYNFQMGNIVFGPTADLSYSFMDGKGTPGALPRTRSNVDMVGSVRGRLGYAFDRILIYGTGGYAFANLEIKNAVAGSDSATLSGWTAGLGAEYLWGEHATLRVEYRRSEFSEHNFQTLPPGQTKVGAGLNIFSGGFVYKF
ncbi:porin [Labrys miyagiensis]|uniref:Porin n=1 Tax=Labrys miyagiensis TaxID=346912 RepID=A0ABQ6CMD4_9HYPH|nr:outer membrane beta-barrel protein [Labrys miyagiensis]GLS20797.1 porin [Labrys miyagiensis]